MPRGSDLAGVFVDLIPDHPGGARYEVRFNTPAWDASLEWLRFHGVDPLRVIAGSRVIRDAPGRRIVVEEYADIDDDGELIRLEISGQRMLATSVVVEQGEAPPLPFPQPITSTRAAQ